MVRVPNAQGPHPNSGLKTGGAAATLPLGGHAPPRLLGWGTHRPKRGAIRVALPEVVPPIEIGRGRPKPKRHTSGMLAVEVAAAKAAHVAATEAAYLDAAEAACVDGTETVDAAEAARVHAAEAARLNAAEAAGVDGTETVDAAEAARVHAAEAARLNAAEAAEVVAPEARMADVSTGEPRPAPMESEAVVEAVVEVAPSDEARTPPVRVAPTVVVAGAIVRPVVGVVVAVRIAGRATTDAADHAWIIAIVVCIAVRVPIGITVRVPVCIAVRVAVMTGVDVPVYMRDMPMDASSSMMNAMGGVMNDRRRAGGGEWR
jgi:hypothetical protein